MIQEFLEEARAYCAARGIKLVTLGRYAVDDKELFPRLLRGGQCLPRTMDRVRAYMAENPHPPAHGNTPAPDQEGPRMKPTPHRSGDKAATTPKTGAADA